MGFAYRCIQQNTQMLLGLCVIEINVHPEIKEIHVIPEF